MKVAILGAGAMGSLIGARLSCTDAEVFLLDADPERIQAIREQGLTIEELDGSRSLYALDIHDVHEFSVQDPIDLVIILVKAPATRAAVEAVQGAVHPDSLFLTLQNGVGHWESIIEKVSVDRLLMGTTAQGATVVEPARIRHGGEGPTYIGPAAKAGERFAHKVISLFNQAGLQTYYSKEIEIRIWQKLMANVAINAITAIADIPNGWIAHQHNARKLAQKAVEEALAVAQRRGLNLPADTIEQVFGIAEATAINRSSMWQDLARMQRTEIDAINGAIVRYGRDLGVPVPINWTLVQLIKIIEERQTERV